MMACRTCLAQVRFGWRHGQPGWWHREDVDHPGFPVVEPPEREVIEIPEPEVRSTRIEDFKDERVPGGVRTVTNLVAKTDGWEVISLTYARGPYLAASGKILSISDAVLLKIRSEQVDGKRHIAVASWRDGKFDFAYIGTFTDGLIRPYSATATELKNWIKGTHDLPDAVPPAGE